MRGIILFLTLGLVWAAAAPALGQIRLDGLDLSGDGDEEGATSLGIDLSDGDETRGDAMTFEGLDVAKPVDEQKLEAATKLFRERNYDAAALGFWEILQDRDAVAQHPQAEYLLGKSLYRMGLYHSALSVFKGILAKGESHRFFSTSLEWLFFIANKATNQTVVLDEIAKYAGAEFPERYRDEYRYLLAKYNFTRGKALMDASGGDTDTQLAYKQASDESMQEVRRLLAMVPRQSTFYPKAKYLDALALYVEGNFSAAVESLKDVVRALNPRRDDTFYDPQLRELAFMQLARIHYEHRQNRYANFYYSRIVRGSDSWLQSLYESAWAHFRLGEYERALGNLITLRSPFFEDEYFPEAMILEAVIYYENCRYPEARQAVDAFLRRYAPLHQELEALLARGLKTPQDHWKALAELQRKAASGDTDRMLERIVRMALSDKELRHLSDSIQELEAEAKGIGGRRELFRFSELAKHLLHELETQRVELTRKAGFYTQRKLERERRELAQLNYRALAIQAEIGSREKDVLQSSLEHGSTVTVVKPYRYSAAVDDEHVYWPYEGEFWRDELGNYEYTLTRGCKER